MRSATITLTVRLLELLSHRGHRVTVTSRHQYTIHVPQSTTNDAAMLLHCWANVFDGGPAVKQHCVSMWCRHRHGKYVYIYIYLHTLTIPKTDNGHYTTLNYEIIRYFFISFQYYCDTRLRVDANYLYLFLVVGKSTKEKKKELQYIWKS